MKKPTFFKKTHPIASREINVVSNLSHLTNERPSEEMAIQTTQPPSQAPTPIPVKTLKIFAVPIFAALSSLSLPILIVLMNRQPNQPRNLSLEQKILEPLVPYLCLVTLRTWLLWNSVGHRLNGRVDASIQPHDDQSENDPTHVAVALVANTASFTNALLAAFAILSNAPPALLWAGSITIGTLNYTKDFFTEVVDAFRKHVESRNQVGQRIKPFFKQKPIDKVTNSAEYFGLVLREILPIASGIIRSQATTQTTASFLATRVSNREISAINIPIGLLVYWSTAYFTRFDLVQFRDNLKAAGKQFVIDNTLSQSSHRPLRLMGKISSGQILIDLLQRIKISRSGSVNVTLMFSIIGMAALIQKALHTYVSSTNSVGVEADNEGILMNYAFGQRSASRLAPDIAVGIACVSISLSVVGTFARSAILHKQAQELTPNQETTQIAIIDTDEERNNQVEMT
ncbi:MAG: hypothetical protein EBY22_06295 [Gammaproteobacteria bacterium]|nr:hypothetical protein [Gammaproteobacteria bacterium]